MTVRSVRACASARATQCKVYEKDGVGAVRAFRSPPSHTPLDEFILLDGLEDVSRPARLALTRAHAHHAARRFERALRQRLREDVALVPRRLAVPEVARTGGVAGLVTRAVEDLVQHSQGQPVGTLQMT